MKTVLSNPLNKKIYEKIEMNAINLCSSSGENKSEEKEASKARKVEKSTQTVRAAMIKQRVENTC